MTPSQDDRRQSVLVTGATGFTGGRLALTLQQRGHHVRALVRTGSDVAKLAEAGIELVEGDITDAESVARAAEGVEKIYHIAAVFRTAGHPDSYYHDVNVGGTEHVIAAARRHGVERTVHCSTVGVHGHVSQIPSNEDSPYNPGDIYQVTKLEADKLAQAAFDPNGTNSVPGSIVRPAGIYGPGDMRFFKLFKTIHTGRFRMFGSGNTLYHFTYIDDLVDGLILCGEHPKAVGDVFIICGDEYVTLNELVRLVSQSVGRKPPRARLPIWPLMAAAVTCEMLCKPFGIDPPLHKRRVEFFIKSRAFTNKKARELLGYRPKVSLPEGITCSAKWYFDQDLLHRPKQGTAAA